MKIIHTSGGDITGELREGVYIYRGIPYGDDCDGKARFLPPKPAKPWQGVRACVKNGAIAMQSGSGSISGDKVLGPHFNGGNPEKFGVADEVQSENCLVLNVLTADHEGKRPVLVYLHGGGYDNGSGSLAIGSDKLVREQDLVLVSVNHRLNAFGYLYLGHLDERYAASGAAGMLDLVLALEWVRDNIAAFGGDPDNVTIMGESGGGGKVCTLLNMPAAKGLFHKAVMISGMIPTCTYTKREAMQFTDTLLKALDTDLEGLIEKPADEILKVYGKIETRLTEPTADGVIIPTNEQHEYLPTMCGKSIPKLFGACEDEYGVFLPIEDTESVTWENLAEKLSEKGIHADIDAWKAMDTKQNSAAHLYLKIISMNNYLCRGAYGQALAETDAAPVYQYMVRYDSPLPADPNFRCAWHTAELPLQMRVVLNPEAELLSKTFAAAIGAFVHTGDPSTEALTWPRFEKDTQITMVFDDTIKSEPGFWKTIPTD